MDAGISGSMTLQDGRRVELEALLQERAAITDSVMRGSSWLFPARGIRGALRFWGLFLRTPPLNLAPQYDPRQPQGVTSFSSATLPT